MFGQIRLGSHQSVPGTLCFPEGMSPEAHVQDSAFLAIEGSLVGQGRQSSSFTALSKAEQVDLQFVSPGPNNCHLGHSAVWT